MKILYITYIDFGEFNSGSSVRPQMMHQAFKDAGCEVKLLQTQQNKRKERCAAVAEINGWLEQNRPDFCYVESPSGPIFNSCDLRLLKKLHKMGIKCGYFYRDAAFKFDDIFITGKKSLKQRVIAWMSERDVKFLAKNVDLIYLPTRSMAQYFPFQRVEPLPPACIGNLLDKRKQKNERQSIYVGGVSKRYGTDTLLKAFDLLNPDGCCEFPLTLICREREAAYIKPEYRDQKWLKVMHVSGKKNLKKQYDQANLALYPIQKNAYHDFAFSVKLMEYMEFGLPVVSVNCKEAANFIEKYQTGLIAQDNPADFAEKVKLILCDQQTYNSFTEQVYRAVKQQNCWVDRARKVMEDLTR